MAVDKNAAPAGGPPGWGKGTAQVWCGEDARGSAKGAQETARGAVCWGGGGWRGQDAAYRAEETEVGTGVAQGAQRVAETLQSAIFKREITNCCWLWPAADGAPQGAWAGGGRS